MRLAVAQLHAPALDAAAAQAATVTAIEQAAAQGAELVVLPEMSAPGYVLDRTALLAGAGGHLRRRLA